MIKYSIVIMGTKPGTPKSQIQETKAYGAAQVNEVLDFDAFCQHLADHNSPYSKGSIRGILTDAVACIGVWVELYEASPFYMVVHAILKVNV